MVYVRIYIYIYINIDLFIYIHNWKCVNENGIANVMHLHNNFSGITLDCIIFQRVPTGKVNIIIIVIGFFLNTFFF